MTNIETQTEIIVGQALTQQLKQVSRLDAMKKSVNTFIQRKEKVSTGQVLKQSIPEKTKEMLSDVPPPALPPKEIEEKILAWAKTHYQTISDIKACADEIAVSAGKVYHTLKHHSFIKQNETTEYRVLSGYFKHNGRLADITKETGLSVWIVAKTIEKLGYSPKWQEYRHSRYATKTTIGIEAEAEFKKLVPEALDANEELRENMPSFDFIINEKTVDVKESALTETRGSNVWRFRIPALIADRADLYCFFLCYNREKRLKGEYDIILVPKEVIPECTRNQSRYRNLNIVPDPKTENYQFYYQFKVEPEHLAYMLTGYL